MSASSPQTSSDAFPLTWTISVQELTKGVLSGVYQASKTERLAVAKALGVPEVKDIRLTYHIAPLARGRFRGDFSLTAHLTQTCVVSLSPLSSTVQEDFTITFWPESQWREISEEMQDREEPGEIDIDPHAEIPEIIREDRLNIGKVAYEQLSLGIDPFPRKAGVNLSDIWSGPEELPTETERPSPFAALKNWKKSKS